MGRSEGTDQTIGNGEGERRGIILKSPAISLGQDTRMNKEVLLKMIKDYVLEFRMYWQ